MTTSTEIRRILMVAPKREAQPVLTQLRTSGHQVSLVEDLDEAGAILGIGGFDQAVLQGESLELLLEQRMTWEGANGESWRRSTAAIGHDLRGLLSALAIVMRDAHGASHGARDGFSLSELAGSVESLSSFTEELTQELVASPASEVLKQVDLEDVVETAAVVVYPSAADRQQRLTIDIDSDVATIATIPVRLKRAIKNLLEFASVRAPENGAILVKATRVGGDCLISVSCEGDSVNRSELARITSPSSSYAGRPGPLALAQEILEPIEGRLWIESEKGGGVNVFIAVPQIWDGPLLASVPTESGTRRR